MSLPTSHELAVASDRFIHFALVVYALAMLALSAEWAFGSRTRFAAVVYRGDRLTASAEVVRLFAHDREERVELAFRLHKDDGSVVIDGAAEFAVR